MVQDKNVYGHIISSNFPLTLKHSAVPVSVRDGRRRIRFSRRRAGGKKEGYTFLASGPTSEDRSVA